MFPNLLKSFGILHSNLEASEARTHASIVYEVNTVMLLQPLDLALVLLKSFHLRVYQV
jgi:hypothetical protein